MNLTDTQIQTILEAQELLIAKPRRAVVNSESGFVSDKISESDPVLAREYWSWYCRKSSRYTDPRFSIPAIIENQKLLDAIDASVKMPKWGYSGT